jgi:hypothetical protein
MCPIYNHLVAAWSNPAATPIHNSETAYGPSIKPTISNRRERETAVIAVEPGQITPEP